MMSFDFLAAIKNIAPMLAGTFGTPLLGFAVSALCNVLPADQAAAVQAAHASDPQGGALAKLGDMFQNGIINTAQIKQAELTHAETMAELGYKNVADLAAISAGDRDSARRRQMTLRDTTPQTLAYMIIGGFFAVSIAQLVGLMWFPENVKSIPPQGWLLIGNISGFLASEAKQAAAYFFGDNASAKEQVKTISEIAKS